MTKCGRHFVKDEIDETEVVRFHAQTGQIRNGRMPIMFFPGLVKIFPQAGRHTADICRMA